MEFLHLFLRFHFAGTPVVMSENVNCFLRLSEERDSNGDDYNNDYDLSNLLYLPKLAL